MDVDEKTPAPLTNEVDTSKEGNMESSNEEKSADTSVKNQAEISMEKQTETASVINTVTNEGENMATEENGGGENKATEQNGGGETIGTEQNGGEENKATEQNGGGENMATQQNFGGENMATEQNGGEENKATEQNGGGENMVTEQNGGGENMATEQNGGGENKATEQNGGGENMATEQNCGGENMATEQNGGGENKGENREPPPEEQPNSNFTSYSTEEINAFMLKPEDVENLEMKDAAISLMHEAKFPGIERHQVAIMVNFLPKDATLVFDHGEQTVQINDMTITSQQIRFACINRIENTTSGYEVVLSYVTEEKRTKLVHILSSDNIHGLVASLNSFRRLTYALYKEILATVEEFGKALRASSPVFTGSLKNLSVYNLETKAYEKQDECMYLYLDTECLMIMTSQFWEDSPYQMYFWTEAVPQSIDKIMVRHDKRTLYIETKTIRLEIQNYDEEPSKSLFESIRKLRPVLQGSFTDHAGRLAKIRNQDHRILVKSPAEGGIGARAWASNAPSRSVSKPGWDEPQQMYYYDNMTETNTIKLKSFKDELQSSVVRLENQEEIALPWVIAEDEITRMLVEGFVPETDILSGGLDPNNLDHFMRCEEEIEHQLVQQQYDKALSRLQGTKKIFMESNLQEMKNLLSLDDIILLKQMYFHSFT